MGVGRWIGIGLVLTLIGCADAIPSEPEPAPAAPVDEQAQARRTAMRTVRSFCLHKPLRVGNRRSRKPAGRRRAEIALARLKAMAAEHQAADDPDWNRLLSHGATFLEDTHCLLEEVPRLDRVLRFFEIPEPEESYDEDPPPEDYEPAYP